MNAAFVLPFTSPDTMLTRAGGKGANLAALTRVGFPVPPGFVVVTDAYQHFVDANQLAARILTCARGVTPDDPMSLDAAAAQISTLFAQAHMPAPLADAITAAYCELV